MQSANQLTTRIYWFLPGRGKKQLLTIADDLPRHGYLVGWNLRSFIVCIACIIESDVEIHDTKGSIIGQGSSTGKGVSHKDLKFALKVLDKDPDLQTLHSFTNGSPTVLGEWEGFPRSGVRTSSPLRSNSSHKRSSSLHKLSEDLWISMTCDKVGRPYLNEIHCLGYRYKTSLQMIFYEKRKKIHCGYYLNPATLEEDSTANVDADSDFGVVLQQINAAYRVEMELRSIIKKSAFESLKRKRELIMGSIQNENPSVEDVATDVGGRLQHPTLPNLEITTLLDDQSGSEDTDAISPFDINDEDTPPLEGEKVIFGALIQKQSSPNIKGQKGFNLDWKLAPSSHPESKTRRRIELKKSTERRRFEENLDNDLSKEIVDLEDRDRVWRAPVTRILSWLVTIPLFSFFLVAFMRGIVLLNNFVFEPVLYLINFPLISIAEDFKLFFAIFDTRNEQVEVPVSDKTCLKEISSLMMILEKRILMFRLLPYRIYKINYLSTPPNVWLPADSLYFYKFLNEILIAIFDVLIGIGCFFFLFPKFNIIRSILASFGKGIAYDAVKQEVLWLMEFPAGVKLNQPLDQFYGRAFLLGIEFWYYFVILSIRSLSSLILFCVMLSSLSGITVFMAAVIDLFNLVTFHIQGFYFLASYLYRTNLSIMYSLILLFYGRKNNFLRNRVDHCDYRIDQLLLGSITFILVFLLFPTFVVYHIFFCFTRLVTIIFSDTLTLLIELLNNTPLVHIVMWTFYARYLPGGVSIVPRPDNHRNSVKNKRSFMILVSHSTPLKCIFAPYSKTTVSFLKALHPLHLTQFFFLGRGERRIEISKLTLQRRKRETFSNLLLQFTYGITGKAKED